MMCFSIMVIAGRVSLACHDKNKFNPDALLKGVPDEEVPIDTAVWSGQSRCHG